jgi:DNA-binding PadR family transcriptional regulator
MSVKHALLGILNEAPAHGYDLKRAFDERLGDLWTLNVGQIYTTLDRLAAEGLVEYEAVMQTDKPDKKIYRITAQGIEEFESWRKRPIKAEPRTLRDELFVKLIFSTQDDAPDLFDLIQAQHSVYMSQMMRLTERKFQVEQTAKRGLAHTTTPEERKAIERQKVMQLMLLDVALFHAEADMRWLKQCEVRLKQLMQI